MVFDVVIVGAGVTGAFAARELSRYELSVCLIDSGSDVATGSSKANSAIVHAGFDAKPGSLKAKLNVEGSRLMESTACELDAPFKKTGSLVLAFDSKERPALEELYARGIANGVKGLSIIDRMQVLNMEPNISQKVDSALYAPEAGITCPYELTVGAVENAVQNGVTLRLETEVTGIISYGQFYTVETTSGEIRSRFIVNAAGINADRLAAMVGDTSFGILPRRGEYVLLDKSQGNIVSKVIFQLPGEKGKGVLVTPTVDGNLLLGPNAEDITDREETSTTFGGTSYVIECARKSIPSLDLRQVITGFAGLRAHPTTDDFIIGPSRASSRFINAAGIESPGLTAAPAAGRYIVEILRSQGLELVPKRDFDPMRKRVVRFRELSFEDANKLVKAAPQYGRVICRCEKVTEGEIVDCIRRPAGATCLDAVKRRTRAGMGRCQGGFCSPRVVEILSRELGITMEQVTKMGGASWILAGKIK